MSRLVPLTRQDGVGIAVNPDVVAAVVPLAEGGAPHCRIGLNVGVETTGSLWYVTVRGELADVVAVIDGQGASVASALWAIRTQLEFLVARAREPQVEMTP